MLKSRRLLLFELRKCAKSETFKLKAPKTAPKNFTASLKITDRHRPSSTAATLRMATDGDLAFLSVLEKAI